MKPKENAKLKPLLEEVLPPSPGETCGPNLATVLGLARQERHRRRRLRVHSATVGTAVLLIAAATVTLFRRTPETPGEPLAQSQSPHASEAAPPANPAAGAAQDPAPAMMVRRIDDEQLMSLLQGVPAALMEWPNGERTLMVVQHDGPRS